MQMNIRDDSPSFSCSWWMSSLWREQLYLKCYIGDVLVPLLWNFLTFWIFTSMDLYDSLFKEQGSLKCCQLMFPYYVSMKSSTRKSLSLCDSFINIFMVKFNFCQCLPLWLFFYYLEMVIDQNLILATHNPGHKHALRLDAWSVAQWAQDQSHFVNNCHPDNPNDTDDSNWNLQCKTHLKVSNQPSMLLTGRF